MFDPDDGATNLGLSDMHRISASVQFQKVEGLAEDDGDGSSEEYVKMTRNGTASTRSLSVR
jgi:hypothetical protein